jgi:hypothetical protein
MPLRPSVPGGQGVVNSIFVTAYCCRSAPMKAPFYDLGSASRVKYAAQGHLDSEAVDRVPGGVVRSRSSARGNPVGQAAGRSSPISARPACGSRPGSSRAPLVKILTERWRGTSRDKAAATPDQPTCSAPQVRRGRQGWQDHSLSVTITHGWRMSKLWLPSLGVGT